MTAAALEFERLADGRRRTGDYVRALRWRVAAKCGVCGRFKQRPSSSCDYCGDDPVTVGGCPHEYDRARGWDDKPTFAPTRGRY